MRHWNRRKLEDYALAGITILLSVSAPLCIGLALAQATMTI